MPSANKDVHLKMKIIIIIIKVTDKMANTNNFGLDPSVQLCSTSINAALKSAPIKS